MKKFLGNLQHAALLLSILTSCLLTAGYSYHLGTITAFGLDSSLVGRDFGEVITESWIVGVKLLVFLWSKIWYPFYYVIAIIIVVIPALLIVAKRKDKGLSNALLDGSITHKNQGSKILGLTLWRWLLIGGLILEMAQFILWPVGILAFALLACALPFKDAHEAAKKTIQEYQKNGCTQKSETDIKYSCIQLIDFSQTPSKQLIEGLFVLSNDKKIAIYANNTLEVFPLNDNYKITRSVKILDPSKKQAIDK